MLVKVPSSISLTLTTINLFNYLSDDDAVISRMKDASCIY